MLGPRPPAPRLATRLAFLAAGFGMASWAPLIPFAKARLAVNDATLGLLLLCVGVGSVAIMPASGALSTRRGSRPAILAGGVGVALTLPALATAGLTSLMAMLLFIFGASLGTLNVAMNVHAVEVERSEGRPLMSSFHALFSVGAFAGSGLMTFLLTHRLSPFEGSILCSLVVGAAIVGAAPHLLAGGSDRGTPLFAWPRGPMLVLAGMAAIAFLMESAMRDWSALLLVERRLVPASGDGVGYMIFSIAMTAGRLLGDAVTARTGDRLMLVAGCGVAMAGLAGIAFAPIPSVALAAHLLLGLGAANIVPILYRRAGTGGAMPPTLAVAALSTVGQGATIVGPAAIGLVSHALGLPAAFAILAVLMAAIPVIASTESFWSGPARAA